MNLTITGYHIIRVLAQAFFLKKSRLKLSKSPIKINEEADKKKFPIGTALVQFILSRKLISTAQQTVKMIQFLKEGSYYLRNFDTSLLPIKFPMVSKPISAYPHGISTGNAH